MEYTVYSNKIHCNYKTVRIRLSDVITVYSNKIHCNYKRQQELNAAKQTVYSNKIHCNYKPSSCPPRRCALYIVIKFIVITRRQTKRNLSCYCI